MNYHLLVEYRENSRVVQAFPLKFKTKSEADDTYYLLMGEKKRAERTVVKAYESARIYDFD